MGFTSPEWVPPMPFDPPDSISIAEFMHNEKYGRLPFSESRNPFTCGVSGKGYTAIEARDRATYLARALSKELGFRPNEGSEWDKVIALFSLNAVDSMVVSYAIHELSGIASPANAAYSTSEVGFQLKSSGAKALFTCVPLLESALKAAKAVGIPNKHIYILALPEEIYGDQKVPFKTVDQLIEDGKKLPPVEPLKWSKGQGAKQTAFLCYSSGTSGLPKGVMISHRNVISNIIQICAYDAPSRKAGGINGKDRIDVNTGLLPVSHIYGLIVGSYSTAYRGDEIIVMPKFELARFLAAVQKYKITNLFLVPPIIIQLINNEKLCSKYDLSSVNSLFTGAAPLGKETAVALQKRYPSWKIRQGYGATETSTVVCSTSEQDIWFGSSGSVVPGVTVKIMSPEGVEITAYDTPGELVVQSPAVVLGYLNNEAANKETFLPDTDGKGRWMRTGDEAMISKSPKGFEHVIITERIKELIKVKGLQVAPAELEAHLLNHPAVADVAVIPVPDDAAGEVPKAYVVKSTSVGLEENDRMTMRSIQKYVEEHKSRHKWLKGGVEFIDVIPKSPSGKILRRLLRDKEKEERRKKGAKL